MPLALSAQDRRNLGLTIAGEIHPGLSTYGTERNRKEIASILGVIENRSTLNKPALFGKTAPTARNKYSTITDVVKQPMQFSTWNTVEERNVAQFNYNQYQQEIEQAIDDYNAGLLTSPVPDATHYWSPAGMRAIAGVDAPSWATAIEGQTTVGPHVFGTAMGLSKPLAKAREFAVNPPTPTQKGILNAELDKVAAAYAEYGMSRLSGPAKPIDRPVSTLQNYRDLASSLAAAGLISIDGRTPQGMFPAPPTPLTAAPIGAVERAPLPGIPAQSLAHPVSQPMASPARFGRLSVPAQAAAARRAVNPVTGMKMAPSPQATNMSGTIAAIERAVAEDAARQRAAYRTPSTYANVKEALRAAARPVQQGVRPAPKPTGLPAAQSRPATQGVRPAGPPGSLPASRAPSGLPAGAMASLNPDRTKDDAFDVHGAGLTPSPAQVAARPDNKAYAGPTGKLSAATISNAMSHPSRALDTPQKSPARAPTDVASIKGPNMAGQTVPDKNAQTYADFEASRARAMSAMPGPPAAPQAPTSMPGTQNVSQLERTLAERNELENIKDQSLGTPSLPAAPTVRQAVPITPPAPPPVKVAPPPPPRPVHQVAPVATRPAAPPKATAFDVYSGMATTAMDNTGQNKVTRNIDGTTSVTNKYGVTTTTMPDGKQAATGSLPDIAGGLSKKSGISKGISLPGSAKTKGTLAGALLGGLVGGLPGAIAGAKIGSALGKKMSTVQYSTPWGNITAAKPQYGGKYGQFPDAPSSPGGSRNQGGWDSAADRARGESMSPGAADAIGKGGGGLY